ncbi:uncharacterized protein [Symphalangus syndactylus]|uniref:uncharacterized protein n=1 Tax=Symphalangus syndactylus TaxID=9590 RepID=UPI0030047B1F
MRTHERVSSVSQDTILHRFHTCCTLITDLQPPELRPSRPPTPMSPQPGRSGWQQAFRKHSHHPRKHLNNQDFHSNFKTHPSLLYSKHFQGSMDLRADGSEICCFVIMIISFVFFYQKYYQLILSTKVAIVCVESVIQIRQSSLPHSQAVWCSLLLLGYTPTQHVTVLSPAGSWNTVARALTEHNTGIRSSRNTTRGSGPHGTQHWEQVLTDTTRGSGSHGTQHRDQVLTNTTPGSGPHGTQHGDQVLMEHNTGSRSSRTQHRDQVLTEHNTGIRSSRNTTRGSGLHGTQHGDQVLTDTTPGSGSHGHNTGIRSSRTQHGDQVLTEHNTGIRFSRTQHGDQVLTEHNTGSRSSRTQHGEQVLTEHNTGSRSSQNTTRGAGPHGHNTGIWCTTVFKCGAVLF